MNGSIHHNANSGNLDIKNLSKSHFILPPEKKIGEKLSKKAERKKKERKKRKKRHDKVAKEDEEEEDLGGPRRKMERRKKGRKNIPIWK